MQSPSDSKTEHLSLNPAEGSPDSEAKPLSARPGTSEQDQPLETSASRAPKPRKPRSRSSKTASPKESRNSRVDAIERGKPAARASSAKTRTPQRPIGGGPLLGQALLRASSRGQVVDPERGDRCLQDPREIRPDLRSGAWQLFDSQLQEEGTGIAKAAKRTPRNSGIERRDRTIAELRDLITATTSDVSALRSDQLQLRDELRRSIDANAAQLGTRDIEVAELRRELNLTGCSKGPHASPCIAPATLGRRLERRRSA